MMQATGRCDSQRGNNGDGSGFGGAPVTRLGQEAAGRSVGGHDMLHLEGKHMVREREEGGGGGDRLPL
jgi:hypothetical protein